MMHIMGQLPANNRGIEQILSKAIRGDGDFRMENTEAGKKLCQHCKIPLKVEEKWLLELPAVYTLGFQYPDLNCQMDRYELKKLWGLLPPKIDLKKFMKVTLDEGKASCSTYVLRGIIVYYGRHYWAYFYSQKFDSWY